MAKQELAYDDAAIDIACLHVGRFFFRWGLLEAGMNSVLSKLFQVASVEAAILTANIRFTDKLYIIHTALQWQGKIHDETWRKRARKLVSRIGRLNRSRNLIAHNLFAPLTNKSVQFYKVEAKGNLSYPEIKWSPKDFERTNCLITAASNELEALTTSLQNRKAIIAALAANPSPSRAPLSLGDSNLPGLLSLFPLELPADQASQSQGPQIDQNPDPKERD